MSSRLDSEEQELDATFGIDKCLEVLRSVRGAEPIDDKALVQTSRFATWGVRNLEPDTAGLLLAQFELAAEQAGSEMKSRAAGVRSNYEHRFGNYAAAVEHAIRGRDIALEAGLEREAAICSNLAGTALHRSGAYREADNWFQEALVGARRCSSRRIEAGALSNRALMATLRGEAQSALSMHDEAISIYSKLEDSGQLARCSLNKGLLLTWLGRLADAELALLSAKSVLEGLGHDTFAVSAGLGLAKVFRLQGRFDNCHEVLNAVLMNVSDGSHVRQHIIALEYYGDALVDAAEYDRASSTFEEAFSLAKPLGAATDVYLETSYRLALANCLAGRGTPASLELARAAIVLARAQNDRFELASALLAFGRCLVALGEASSATPILRECLQIARATGDKFTHAAAALFLSKLMADSGSPIDAMGLAYDAKLDFESLPSPRWAAEANTWLGELMNRLATVASSATSPRTAKKSPPKPDPTPIPGIPDFIAGDPRVRQILMTTLKLSPRGLSMLVMGESGTGKELVAEAIHNASERPGQFVAINCGALPGDLLEAELFGHARGAYTGADRERGGLIEYSNHGTLFLDEIGDMPLKAQARLLRALERGEIRRLGENTARLVDLRIVAATHRNLLEMVSANEFRLDLYHRLTGFVITLPALRDRGSDVNLLIDHFLSIYSREQDKVVALSPEVRAQLGRHSWPGNVRELRNVILRLVSLSEPGQTLDELPFHLEGAESPRTLPEALDAEERRRIVDALQASGWNKAKAAVALGASRTTLIGKMKRLGIEPPLFGARVR